MDQKQIKMSVESAISHFYTTMGELRDEVTEAADNLEERFSGTSRYQALRDAADAIDSFADDEPDTLRQAGELNLMEQEVSFPEARKVRRSVTRPARRDEAVAAAQAAVDFLRGWVEETGEGDEGDDRISEVEELCDTLEEHISEAESVEFPGMYR